MELRRDTYLQEGRYKIISSLGKGGFGITYKATQKGLDRKVAIKEFFMSDICSRDESTSFVSLLSDKNRDLWDGFKMKFLKEARTIAQLNHPNIVKIIDVFEENGTAYYAMEYIEAGSLKSLVRSNGILPEEQAISIISKVGEALEYIHSKNILHLDIKPDNIMMKDGKDPTIIDFGISKRYDESGSQTSMMPIGRSRGYAPIEQYKQGGLASFSPATDVYSLAATLYYLLGGACPPEPGDIYDSGLPVLPDISAQTMEVLTKGMAVSKADRPQNAGDFLKLLKIPQKSVTPEFDHENFRSMIESLEIDKDYKEAYNRCLNAIQNGHDVEFAKDKASELISIMKRKNRLQSFLSVIVAIAVSILVTVISVMI